MGEAANLFVGTALDGAGERRRAYARVFDPATRRFLAGRGIAAGARCLELDAGAGDGELAAWLAEHVAPGGAVVSLCAEPRPPIDGVELRLGNPLAATLEPGAFELVHARAALIHAPQFMAVLAVLVRAVRPGGWLVLEEPDFSAARAFTGSFDQRQGFTNVNRAREALFRADRTDSGFGARLPALLQARGLEALSIENDAPMVCGGDPLAVLVAGEVVTAAGALCATGLVSPRELDDYVSFSADPSCWAIPHAVIRAAGRKPAP